MSISCPSFVSENVPVLCEAVDIYCERTDATFWSEPLNAISNGAFLIAAFLLFRLQSREQNRAVAVSSRGLAVLVAIIGIGSFLFHTFANEWSRWADVIPILLFMLVYCWLAMTLFFQWPWILKAVVLLLFIGATAAIEIGSNNLADYLSAHLHRDVAKTIAGGAFYVPTLLFLLGFAFALIGRSLTIGLSFLAATAVFVLSYTLRSMDGPLCDILPIGTHYFWHICNSIVLYLLVRILILHAPLDTHAAGAPATNPKLQH